MKRLGDGIVVLASFGGTVFSADTDGASHSVFIQDFNLDVLAGFTDGVVEGVESKFGMSEGFSEVRCEVGFVAECLSLQNLGSLALQHAAEAFAIFSFLDNSFSFDLLLEVSQVHFVDVVVTHLSLQECLEGRLPLQLSGLHLIISSVVLQYSDELCCVHDGKLGGRIDLVLGIAALVGYEGHNDENGEESQGEPSFVGLNFFVTKALVHPDIGQDGEDSGDSEHFGLFNLLHSLDCLVFLNFLISSLVRLRGHCHDGYAGNNQQVEGRRSNNSGGTEFSWLGAKRHAGLQNVEHDFRGTGS